MHYLTVKLDDDEMAALVAEARATDTKPEDVLAQKFSRPLQQPGSVHDINTRIPDTVAPPDFSSDAQGVWYVPSASGVLDATLEERRASRRAILKGDGPLWTGEPGRPKDGYYYEQELRAEW